MSRFNPEKFEAVCDGLERKGIDTYGPKVMVLPFDPDDTTAGGLIIPDSAKKKTAVGTVIQLGCDTEAIEAYAKGIEVGKHVSYPIVEGKVHAIAITREWADKLGLHYTSIETLVIHAGNMYIGWKEQ